MKAREAHRVEGAGADVAEHGALPGDIGVPQVDMLLLGLIPGNNPRGLADTSCHRWPPLEA